jgi:ABC-2 type transport system ATP-binding protein
MSMDLAIETNALSKFYGPLHAVDSVDLRVGRGEIYGFLGLNGAGKTTTIRALLGMIRPSAGSVTVLGQAVGPNGRGPWRQVGHLVESPAAYPELTVRENLEIARRLQGISDTRATAGPGCLCRSQSRHPLDGQSPTPGAGASIAARARAAGPR